MTTMATNQWKPWDWRAARVRMLAKHAARIPTLAASGVDLYSELAFCALARDEAEFENQVASLIAAHAPPPPVVVKAAPPPEPEPTYEREVLALVAGGKSMPDALLAAQAARPDLHEQWVRARCPRIGGPPASAPTPSPATPAPVYATPMHRPSASNPATFAAAVQDYMTRGQSMNDALVAAAETYPEQHRAWVVAGAPKIARPTPTGTTYSALVVSIMATGASKGDALLRAQAAEPTLHEQWVRAGCASIDPPAGNADTYAATVRKLRADGMSKGDSLLEAQRRDPTSHQCWVDARCPNVD